jgi:type III secretion system low calcium response chaperone LcrH/SycD
MVIDIEPFNSSENKMIQPTSGSSRPSPEKSEAIGAFLKEMLQLHFQGEAILQEACGLSNSSLETLYEQAYDSYTKGKGMEAARYFGLLIALNPFQQKFWMGLAASQQLEKKYDKALQAYALAALLDDRDPIPHYHAAQCYLAMGNKKDAIKALELAEAHASVHSSLAPLRNRILGLKETLYQRVKGSPHE